MMELMKDGADCLDGWNNKHICYIFLILLFADFISIKRHGIIVCCHIGQFFVRRVAALLYKNCMESIIMARSESAS